MIDTDYPNAAAAFELFIRAPWHWPLGENPGFGGVNLFFSDGAPWFAFIAKGIYQLTGIALSLHWLVVINMVLWPVMAWRLVGTLHPTPAGRWLAVLLLTFNLIVMVRLIGAQHIALGSYWVVLWARIGWCFGRCVRCLWCASRSLGGAVGNFCWHWEWPCGAMPIWGRWLL